jgi:transcription elongation factor GreA
MATLEKLPILPSGYAAMQAQLQRLKSVDRPEVVTAIEEARAHGDLSENAEYHAAKERQGQIEAQIIELEDQVARAQVIDPKELSGDKVVFGATVELLDEDDKPVVYQIVGPYEADAKQGRISYTSPLGRALIGRRVGDEVEVATPSGDRYYEIAKLRFV